MERLVSTRDSDRRRPSRQRNVETEKIMTKQTYEDWRATRHLRPNFEQDQEESSDEMWQEIVSYYINLNRRRRKITQKQIAEALKISQPGVCQMLKRPATVGKLWRLSLAMGGELEVNIRFGDKVYPLLGELLPISQEE